MMTPTGDEVTWVDRVPWAAVWGTTTFGLSVLGYILLRANWKLGAKNTEMGARNLELAERNAQLNELNHTLAKEKAESDKRVREPPVKIKASISTLMHGRSFNVMVTGDGGDVYDLRVTLDYPGPDLGQSFWFETSDDVPEVLKYGRSVMFRMWNEFPHTPNPFNKMDLSNFTLCVYSGARPIYELDKAESVKLIEEFSRVDMSLPAPPPPTEDRPDRRPIGTMWRAIVRG